MPARLLITGAASGIGKELASRAFVRGDRVFGADLSDAALAPPGAGAGFRAIRMDVADNDSVLAAFAEVDRELGGEELSGVIHCAGVSPSGAFEVMPIEIFERTMSINALGTARVMRAAIPRLRGHDGRLILVSSVLGRIANPMLAAYSGSKFAIEAYVDAARRETRGMGLQITVVEPGVIRTPMLERQIAESGNAARELEGAHQRHYGALYRSHAALVAKGAARATSVERCAHEIERVFSAARAPARRPIGSDSRLGCVLARALPDRVLDRLLASLLR